MVNHRIKDLFLEVKQTYHKTPEDRLKTVFELIELSEALFNASNAIKEKTKDEN